ncbi:MAG: hypothetical protein ABIS36_05545 [Chryseolinea sp.]
MSVVPKHRPVNKIDARSSVELSNEKIAIVFFEVVRNRLQHVNSWPIIAENLATTFQLANKEGIEVYRKAKEGDFVKMIIESPESKNFSSVNWNRIQSLTDISNNDGIDSFGFNLTKCNGPINWKKDGVHHSNDSLCEFIVARTGKIVTASILEIGKDAEGAEIRKNAIGTTGSSALVHIDWQKLANGLISR